MNRYILCSCALAAGCIFIAAHGQAATIFQWSVADGGNGHYYELVGSYPNQLYTWQDANTMADALSYLGIPGHLVTIGSAAEEQFITDTFYANYTLPMWIGLTDDPAYGGYDAIGTPDPQVDGWVWVTGEPVTYTDWSPNQPGNVQPNSDYVAIGAPLDSHPTWGNFQSGTGGTAEFLVEFDVVPEPSSIALLSIGAISLFARVWQLRRRGGGKNGIAPPFNHPAGF